MKSEEERREKRRGEYLEMDEGEVGREIGLKQDIVSAPLPDLNQHGWKGQQMLARQYCYNGNKWNMFSYQYLQRRRDYHGGHARRR